MLIREIVARIKSLYNRGAASDDTRLSNRHIYSKIRSVRSLLIKREQDKKRKTSPWNIQVIHCLKLELADPSECGCVILDSCKLLKSVCKIPKPIQSNFGTGIENVSTLDGSIVFSPTTWAKKRYKSGNKYTANTADYFIRDDYLYITHNTLLERVAISGIFEDPVTIDQFNSSGECACQGDPEDACSTPMDTDLSLDEYLIDPLIELSLKELIEIFKKMDEDNQNNAKATETANEKE